MRAVGFLITGGSRPFPGYDGGVASGSAGTGGFTVFYDITGVLLGLGAFLVAYASYRYSRSSKRREVNQERVKSTAHEVAAELTAPLSLQVAGAVASVKELAGLVTRIDTQGSSGLGLVTSRVSVLESKIEVFWKNVAYDVSQILHSPHSGWEHLDALLEKFRASLRPGGAQLSPGEMTSLEEQLRGIVSGQWDSGAVSRADQVAASLMLRAIEQTRV